MGSMNFLYTMSDSESTIGGSHIRLFPNHQKSMVLSQLISLEEGRTEAQFQPDETPSESQKNDKNITYNVFLSKAKALSELWIYFYCLKSPLAGLSCIKMG